MLEATKEAMIPVKMEYVDNADAVYRTIEALDVQDVGGFPTVMKMKVSDLRTGGHTISEFGKVQYNNGIPDDVFTERTLRNPPREWFKGN